MSKAGKRKGLSMEEKCEKIDAWFDSHPHPYTLKELTSLIPKTTGVIWQSVEECVELLVSERKVQQDKVGVHTLFWRFPFTKTQTQLIASGVGPSSGTAGGNKGGRGASGSYSARTTLADRLALLSVEQLQEQKNTQAATLLTLDEELSACRADVGNDDAVQRDTKAIQACQQLRQHLIQQLQRLAAFNPQLLTSLKAATNVAFVAANRWTDNYFLLEQHMAARMGIGAREMRTTLRVPEELDFVEWAEIQPSHGAVEKGGQGEKAPLPVCTSTGELSATQEASLGGSQGAVATSAQPIVNELPLPPASSEPAEVPVPEARGKRAGKRKGVPKDATDNCELQKEGKKSSATCENKAGAQSIESEAGLVAAPCGRKRGRPRAGEAKQVKKSKLNAFV